MNIIDINPDASYPCSPLKRSTNFTSLMYLVYNTCAHPEYLDQIKYILDNYPEELDKKNNAGWTALMIACRNSNTSSTLKTVELLLKYNPDVNASRQDQEHILSIAVSYSNTDSSYETVKLLLDHGADITKIISMGDTVLHKKYIHNLQVCNIKAVKLLIDRAPKSIFYTKNSIGYTPFRKALILSDDYHTDLNYELVKYFLDHTPIDFYEKTKDNCSIYVIVKRWTYIDVLDVKCALD